MASNATIIENYQWDYIERPLKMLDEDKLIFYIPDRQTKEFISPTFPWGLPGFSFPKNVDLNQVTLVVNPYVSKSFPNGTMDDSKQQRDCLKNAKGKKRSQAFPAFEDEKSYALNGDCRFYRFILINRNGKVPVLFIGMDFGQKELYRAFWPAAMALKAAIHGPKAPIPNNRPNNNHNK